MFAKHVEGRHSHGLVHVLWAVEKFSFSNDFGVNFLTGGTPGASRAALDDQVGSQVDFLMVFRCPGGGFWRPCGPFGRHWARLGATLGVTLAPEAGRGDSKRKLLVHIEFPSPF